ncbi:MAG TPA: hypothetical protein ENI41_05885, partial [Deltaproteobacteria bacterium]|nr:hypothetical protein [Deltaproteobacteria bacterium]
MFEIINIYNDYLFLKNHDYRAAENMAIKANDPQEYGMFGSMIDETNYFSYMLPYDPKQNDETNILLNCTSGLCSETKRRKMWKEVFIHNILQRPIHDIMDDLDKELYSSLQPLYAGRYKAWEKNATKVSEELSFLADGAKTISTLAQILLKVDNYITASKITKLDSPEKYVSWEDFEQLIESEKHLYWNHETQNCLERFKQKVNSEWIDYTALGIRITGDIFQGFVNHAIAQGYAQDRADALAFILQYAQKSGILFDSEIANGLEDAFHEFNDVKENAFDSVLSQLEASTFRQYSTYKTLFKASTSILKAMGYPALKTVTSAPGAMMLSSFLYVAFNAADDWDIMRHGAISAVLQNYIWRSLISYQSERLTDCNAEVVRKLRNAHSLLYFNGFYYFDNLKRVSEVKWYDPYSWLQSLLEYFTSPGSVSSLADEGISRNLTKFAEFAPPYYSLATDAKWITTIINQPIDSPPHFTSPELVPTTPKTNDNVTFRIQYNDETGDL